MCWWAQVGTLFIYLFIFIAQLKLPLIVTFVLWRSSLLSLLFLPDIYNNNSKTRNKNAVTSLNTNTGGTTESQTRRILLFFLLPHIRVCCLYGNDNAYKWIFAAKRIDCFKLRTQVTDEIAGAVGWLTDRHLKQCNSRQHTFICTFRFLCA